MAADEVVQLYLSKVEPAPGDPLYTLVGFQRVSLKPGERRDVAFAIDREALVFHDIDMNYAVEPGEFEIMVGPSSVDVKKTILTVTGP